MSHRPPTHDFAAAVRKLRESPEFDALLRRSSSESLPVTGLSAAACGWVLANLAAVEGAPIVAVMPRESEALEATAGARLGWSQLDADQLPSPQVIHYTAPALTPFQETDPALRVLAGHARALDSLVEERPALVIVDAAALSRPLPQPRTWVEGRLSVEVGDEIDRDALLQRLVAGGYERAEQVAQVGEFAVRGAVVDVFSPAHETPVRAEFFGDEVVSLRRFDPATQRTGTAPAAGSDAGLRVLPLLPFARTTSSVRRLAEVLAERVSPLAEEEAQRRLNTLAAGGMPAGWSEWLGLAADVTTALTAWCPGSRLVVWDPTSVIDALEESWSALEEDASGQAHRVGFEIQAEEVGMEPEGFKEDLTRAGIQVSVWVEVESTAAAREDTPVDFRATASETVRDNPQRLAKLLAAAEDRGQSTWLVHSGESTIARRFLDEHDLGGRMGLLAGDLRTGFVLPSARLTLFAESQLYSLPPTRRRTAASERRRRETFLGGLKDLKVGDHVVHDEHGIGRYAGIRRVGDDGDGGRSLPEWASRFDETEVASAEVLEIEYRDGRTLLLPIDRVGRLSRFTGVEGTAPRLDSLGGTSWQSKRERVRSGVKKLAVDLLALYASRHDAEATAMPAGGPLQQRFEDSFPYQETPDQQRVIEEVQRDLVLSRPMDRLLCGDVGFGKTEVAMRAAAQAVEAGCQVAVLAPTTILADQHHTSFRRRFRGLPVKIEMLSRFLSDAETRGLFRRLEAGEIDILIGTHRLLGEVPFSNLGLLVVDEEQRFGVGQKEKLVEARRNIHVLSMSATPVPRTLQLALGGVRDLSLIETPPRDRMAVETAVVPFSKHLVREACDYEHGRGGQIYYLHNRVESIDEVASRLRRWLPGLRITVGHGQLPEDQLARRMHAFADGEYDLLLATTIIANGIDIPNVNTMLIHDAHRFGLGELYQLRGRVGRSDRLGFCYLMVAPDRVVSQTARRRLTAIREFTELGAGFRVAARDLQIRGAGDVLGAEQSGHIGSVGVETYLKMLDNEVKRLRGEEVVEEVSCEIELPGGAGIPESYVEEPGLRLDLYQRLAEAGADLEGMRAEMADRFGPPPAEVEALIAQHQLRREAERVRVQSISYRGRSLHLRFRADARVDIERLVEWMQDEPRVDFSPSGVLSVHDVGPEEAVPVGREVLEQLLQRHA